MAVTLAWTDATRLRPEYVKSALDNRAADERLNAVFERALGDSSEQAMSDLIRALELKFIHDPATSTLDLLGPERGEYYRNFDWQFGDYPGGPDGPNEQLVRNMDDELDLVRPERRANTGDVAAIVREEATEDVWQYMVDEWVTVPVQPDYMLNRHAAEAFVKMHEQAKREGVDLVILSAHRTRKRAEANAARANNPAAVASFSSHSLGLAVDFKMSAGDFQVEEISTRPMSNIVKMRESPVHKWLLLRGADFGWYPYQHEPWHWEYNPSGFREKFWSNFPTGAPD